MKAGMFRIVGVSGKQQEVQPLLDQPIIPSLIDQGASIEAGRVVLARMRSRTGTKSNRLDLSLHNLECHEMTTAVESGEGVVLYQNIKKIRNKRGRREGPSKTRAVE